MNNLSKTALITIFITMLTACSDTPKQDVGAIAGAIGGAALGTQIGCGSGRTVAILGGTLIGGYIGGSIGKSMDDVDKLKMNQSLETTRTHNTSTWQNPDSGNTYSVTPIRTYQNRMEQPCREYNTTANIGGKVEKIHGTACREADGSWRVIS